MSQKVGMKSSDLTKQVSVNLWKRIQVSWADVFMDDAQVDVMDCPHR